jgi:predicted ATPase
MLEYLELDNVGPAPRMKIEFAPRVNIITGDNGLGKSFLLDTAWWALTGAWPAEVNRRMTSGLPARPRDKGQEARILWRTRYGDGVVESGLRYSRTEEAWMMGWTPPLNGIGMCQGGAVATHHLEEEASYGARYHHRHRSGEAEFSVARRS